MPPPVKVKGRPKGSDQTNVSGTKKASKKKVSCQKFVEMRNADKDKLMLTLCIGKEATEIVLRRGGVVNLEDIDPTEISNAVFNPIICLESIRYLFSDEAWDSFKFFYNSKARHFRYICNFCNKSNESGDDLIACESCLHSFHFTCVKLKKVVKKRQTWFCVPCKAKNKLSEQSTE